jgi:WD40 repeat protein
MRAPCLSLLLVVCLAIPCPADGPQADPYGQPLPAGAVARLAATPLRHEGLADFVFVEGGRTILTAGGDGLLRFWDSASGRQRRIVPLQGARAGKHSALSRDGKTFALFDQGKLFLWDTASGKQIKSLTAPKAGVAFLVFAPDGQALAVGDRDGHVSLWQWRQGKERRLPLPAYTTDVTGNFHASFSPDGKLIAAGGGWREPLCVFDAASGRQLRRFNYPASASVFLPDGKHLLIAALENDKQEIETVLRLFDLSSGKQAASFPQRTEEAFFTLAVSADGKLLACGPSERAGLLDLTSGQQRYYLTGSPVSLAFSPDGKLLAGISGDRVRLWDAARGKERRDQTSRFGPEPVLAVSPGGRLLAAVDAEHATIVLWDTRDGRLVRLLPLGETQKDFRSLAFSDDGQTLFAARPTGLLLRWDVKTGRERPGIQLRDAIGANGQETLYYQVKVWPAGKYAATLERLADASSSARLTLWEIPAAKPASQHLLTARSPICAWSPDGAAVALTLDAKLALVDVRSGAALFQAPEEHGQGPFAFSPDGKLLAVRRAKSMVSVWETATGQEVGKLSVGRCNGLTLLTDDRSLVTASDEGLQVWDLATGKERLHRPFPKGLGSGAAITATALAPLPAGRLCTPLDDGTALIWDLSPAPRPARPASEKELAGWWADLAAKDARRAYAAVWRLGEAPGPAVVALFRRRLKPAADADLKEIQRLIAELGHNRFQVREKAFKRLNELGGTALPALRYALENNPTLEVRRRLELLLDRPAHLIRSPEVLRRLRAIGVLEQVGSPEARHLLEELAKGLPGAPETEAVRAALRRLAARLEGL